ncbi:MAG TPA: FAD-binding and (Fe-S)-binding domain-containing protein [Candidatus Binataceae bacterium]|nr:FAD-binding and (Fe-S)-binding domain-containing protein [Candidatus Binataceae bacterium]
MGSLEALLDQLRTAIDGDVRFDAAARTIYATDASNYRRVPVGVVIPRHQDDVIRAVALARENGLPIVPRGGGTALAGQTTTPGLVLDFSKYMNRVTEIDPTLRLATVEPGVVQAQLNAAADAHGLFFAPDPSTKDRCTLGGMIGNNSCGAHSAAYGKTVDNVAQLDALLYDGTRLTLGPDDRVAGSPDGRATQLRAGLLALRDRYADRVRARYPKIPRRVSGYNLDQLLPENGFNLARAIVGSEGTLATLLSATVRLVPKPAAIVLVVMGFADVFAAADQTPWLLEYHPQALEGFDHRLPDFARAKGMPAVKLLPDGRAFLVMELGGDTSDDVRAIADDVKRQALRHKDCAGVAILTDTTDQRAVWSIRESGLGAGALIPGQPRTWPGAEDCAVPPARLGDFLRRLVPMLARYDLAAATYYGHFGEGCVHCRINFDFFTADGVAKFRAAMIELGNLVVEFGGSLSGEHGDGLARSELLPIMFGPDLLAAFREFKQLFDPDHRMNPGVIVDPEPLDAHLRVGPLPDPTALRTHFDFSAEGGLAGSALKCVGLGKCRKTDAGTMCPSYMATRDETHSTRGRARLLYEALNGDLLKDGFADEALYEALELCLSCKACKTECPASVDMAKYKAEFLAHYYTIHRRAAATLFFGYIHDLARVASIAPHIANRFTRGPLAKLMRRTLGFHRDRDLPHFAAQSFRSWFRRRDRRNEAGREVLLFPDTFNNFFEPAIAIAATELLERAGCRVVLPARDLCCGRPLMEAGMLDAARVRLANILTTLGPVVARGTPIVGLEPSCLLTLRDELPAMFPRSSAARGLADHALLLDEFLTAQLPGVMLPELSTSGARLPRGASTGGGRVGESRPELSVGELPQDSSITAMVHGHCHQKALAGMNAEVALLGRIEGLKVELPDSGCCGMAGSFGYGASRFDLSRAIGERVLLPAIRNSAPGSIIIADGFACRAQIRQFCSDRRPLHLAQVLNSATASSESPSSEIPLPNRARASAFHNTRG